MESLYIQLFDKRKESLANYLAKRYIPSPFFSFKEDDINSVYIMYPDLFVQPLTNKIWDFDNQDLCKLSWSGHLFFTATILYDKIIDENIEFPFDLFAKAQHLHEDCLRTLCEVYGSDNRFWEKWYLRQSEFQVCVRQDIAYKQRISDKNKFFQCIPCWELTVYERYAAGKSALGKIAIDGVYHLFHSKEDVCYERLLLSHDYASIALQMLDDVFDFDKDIEHPQLNIAHHYLKHFLEEKQVDINKYTTTDLKKILYLENIAAEIFQMADTYFLKAADVLAGTSSQMWLAFIQNKRKKTNMQVQEIYKYIDNLRMQSKEKLNV